MLILACRNAAKEARTGQDSQQGAQPWPYAPLSTHARSAAGTAAGSWCTPSRRLYWDNRWVGWCTSCLAPRFLIPTAHGDSRLGCGRSSHSQDADVIGQRETMPTASRGSWPAQAPDTEHHPGFCNWTGMGGGRWPPEGSRHSQVWWRSPPHIVGHAGRHAQWLLPEVNRVPTGLPPDRCRESTNQEGKRQAPQRRREITHGVWVRPEPLFHTGRAREAWAIEHRLLLALLSHRQPSAAQQHPPPTEVTPTDSPGHSPTLPAKRACTGE